MLRLLNTSSTGFMRKVTAEPLAILSIVSALMLPVVATAQSLDQTTCLLKPHQLVQLGSPVAGLLVEEKVDRGDVVQAGQVVASLESSVEAATVSLDRVKASNDNAILAEQEELALNQRNAGRKQSLAQAQIVNANSLDELQTKVRESELKIREAVTEQRIAQLTALRSAAQLALKQIHTPIDGVITERKLSPGEYVYEQTPIMTIAQINPLNVELVLPADRYGSIHVGDQALVKPADPVGGSYEAQVVVVDPVIDAASSTFGVRLLLPNPTARIPAGLRCSVVWRSAPQAARTTP